MKKILLLLLLSRTFYAYAQDSTLGYSPYNIYWVDFKKGLISDKTGKTNNLPFDVPFIIGGKISSYVQSIELFIISENFYDNFKITEPEIENCKVKMIGNYKIVTSKSKNKPNSLYVYNDIPKDSLEDLIDNKNTNQIINNENLRQLLLKIAIVEKNKKYIQYHKWAGNEIFNKITGDNSDKALDSFYVHVDPLRPFTKYKILFIVNRKITTDEKTNFFNNNVYGILDNKLTEGKSNMDSDDFIIKTIDIKSVEITKTEPINIANEVKSLNDKRTELIAKHDKFKNNLNILNIDSIGKFLKSVDSIYSIIHDSTKVTQKYPELITALKQYVGLNTSNLEKKLKGLKLDVDEVSLDKITDNNFTTNKSLQETILTRYKTNITNIELITKLLRTIQAEKLIKTSKQFDRYLPMIDEVGSILTSIKNDISDINSKYNEILVLAKATTNKVNNQQTLTPKVNGLTSEDYVTRANWYLLPDIGVATLFDFNGNNNITTYAGVNIHFGPLNRQATYSIWRKNPAWRNVSLTLGITNIWFQSNSIFNSEKVKVNHLWSNNSLLTGVGFRMFEGLRVTCGAVWGNQVDARGLNSSSNTVPIFYASVSLDIKLSEIIKKSINTVKGLTQ